MFIDDVLTPVDMIRGLGARFKEYRLRMELTQREVAQKSGLSLPTIYKFENGRLTDMSMFSFLQLLRAINLGANWEKLIPDLPDSPYMYRQEKRKQRIRHTK